MNVLGRTGVNRGVELQAEYYFHTDLVIKKGKVVKKVSCDATFTYYCKEQLK